MKRHHAVTVTPKAQISHMVNKKVLISFSAMANIQHNKWYHSIDVHVLGPGVGHVGFMLWQDKNSLGKGHLGPSLGKHVKSGVTGVNCPYEAIVKDFWKITTFKNVYKWVNLMVLGSSFNTVSPKISKSSYEITTIRITSPARCQNRSLLSALCQIVRFYLCLTRFLLFIWLPVFLNILETVHFSYICFLSLSIDFLLSSRCDK